MFGKLKNEKPGHTASAPTLLGDEELSTVAGGCHRRRRRGHGRRGGGFDLESLLGGGSFANLQTNVSGPIIQIAIGNGGDVFQFASVSQGNSASL